MAVHLSLLSLANGWSLPLQQSQQICNVFHGDIRRAILHLQFTLSWLPSDPASPLLDEIHVNDDIPVLSRRLYPWKENDVQFLPSHLDHISLLADWKSDMDCISTYHQSPDMIKLKPSLLDELPQNLPFACSVENDLVNTLSGLLFSYSGCTRRTSGKIIW